MTIVLPKVPVTVIERAVERFVVVALVAGLTDLLNNFNSTTAAGLAGYWAIKTLIDFMNPGIPNTAVTK